MYKLQNIQLDRETFLKRTKDSELLAHYDYIVRESNGFTENYERLAETDSLLFAILDYLINGNAYQITAIPLADIPESDIVHVDSGAFAGIEAVSDRAKAVEAFLKEAINALPENERYIINKQTGLKIGFDTVGIKELANSRVGEVKSKIIFSFQEFIEKGHLIKVQPDKGKDKSLLAVYTFAVYIEYEGTIYEMWFIVKHRANGKFLYATALDMKKPLT